MPYILREDGEQFVIPSYRDTLTATNKALLKKEILELSQNYGAYITLQRKSATKYEIAFSPDPGYLLGESIWHYFKSPLDMIYCEALPNTTEVLLVIVKNGAVYLDGLFPQESIAEELVIFLTQENRFDIYTFGDVPISAEPEEGKFNFEAALVKSFTILEQPVFATIPLLKIYQLQLVNSVLRAHSIGVFPLRQLMLALVAAGLIWMTFSYISSQKKEVPVTKVELNPFQGYSQALTTPAPDEEILQFLQTLHTLFTIPGWSIVKIQYVSGKITVGVQSNGAAVQVLMDWAKTQDYEVEIQPEGLYLSSSKILSNRPPPKNIYPIKEVFAYWIDRLAAVYPGNHLKIDSLINKGVYSEISFTVTVDQISPVVLSLIGEELKNTPIVLDKIEMTVLNGSLSGNIFLKAMGN